MTTIYHLAMPADWLAAQAAGVYRMSTRGLTLDEVGFIHCSTADQVPRTASAYYADVDELTLLSIDADRVGAEIRVEQPDGSDEGFPHLYGPLPVDAVITTQPYRRAGDGRHPPVVPS